VVTSGCKCEIRSSSATSKCAGEKKGRLTIQCDEQGSFVDNKGNKQWEELAIDMKTREIVGVYIRERSLLGAKGLWVSLPRGVSAVRGVL
jgi:hypothetical protein